MYFVAIPERGDDVILEDGSMTKVTDVTPTHVEIGGLRVWYSRNALYIHPEEKCWAIQNSCLPK